MIKVAHSKVRDTLSHTHDYFLNFKGQIIYSKDIAIHDYTNKRIAIIGIDQSSVSQLEIMCSIAKYIEVFQIRPQYILPKTEKVIQRLLNHPLLIKNRKLFSQRLKSLVALRFLESEVPDTWLKRQLMPNTANIPKKFLKSDYYYLALQRENCQLITWPIKKIHSNSIISIEGTVHPIDIIIITDQ